MDSITHLLIGAAIGKIAPQKSLKATTAMLIGALACSSPDFDLLIQFPDHPLALEEFHRGFTHSLFWIPFGTLLLTVFMSLSFKTLRPHWRSVALISLLAIATHGPLDACTAYGTELFWPFIQTRISWDLISIVDPVFTAILTVGLIANYWSPQNRPLKWALFLCVLYLLGFCGFQHHRAQVAQQELISSRGKLTHAERVMPSLGSQYIWHSVYFSGNGAYLDLISTPLFGKSDKTEGFSVPLFAESQLPAPLLQNTQSMQQFEIFKKFTQGYLAVSYANPLTLVDLRYVLRHEHPVAMWGVTFEQGRNTYSIVKNSLISLEDIKIKP